MHFFLLTLYNFKNIGGGARAPLPPPYSAFPVQQLKTISDKVLTAYIFTIKDNSIELSFQYTRRWQPVKVYECAVGAVGLHRFLATAFTHKAFRCRATGFTPEAAQAAQTGGQSCVSSASAR